MRKKEEKSQKLEITVKGRSQGRGMSIRNTMIKIIILETQISMLVNPTLIIETHILTTIETLRYGNIEEIARLRMMKNTQIIDLKIKIKISALAQENMMNSMMRSSMSFTTRKELTKDRVIEDTSIQECMITQEHLDINSRRWHFNMVATGSTFHPCNSMIKNERMLISIDEVTAQIMIDHTKA